VNYKIIENDKKFDVFETQTDVVLKTFKSKSEAKELAKSLNLGSGFDGFTPSFFLIKG
jgi:hypothetical protein